MAQNTIPDPEREEWRQLVKGQIEHEFQNYVLQMKIHQANKQIAGGKKTVEEAVQEIYDLCAKYSKAVQPDFQAIFKNW